MIALDGCQACNLDIIRPDLALEALTKDSDNSGQHGEEPLNFQAGMGKNYERLEFLGDCFLKMSTSIAMYTQQPELNEFSYHVDRMCLICNQNLFKSALKLNMHEYIRSREFDRRSWYPPGLTLKRGKRGKIQTQHSLGDKTMADVCEALIGAAYLTTYKQKNMDLAVKAVSKFVRHPIHTMETWDEFYALYRTPKWQTAVATAAQVEMAAQIKEKLGYEFKYPRLLRTAFMHASYPFHREQLPSYQQLEFLGDALFDMMCVKFLFFRFPQADPQWMTEHKMAMVSNQFLGCLAVELGFHRHMRSFSQEIHKTVQVYVEDITAAREEAVEKAVRAGRKEGEYSRHFWCESRHPPKCLPDLVEAFIGALFVDSEYKLAVVEDFFERFVRHYFDDMSIYDTYANKHPITFLSNIMSQHFRCLEWRVLVHEVAANSVERDESDTESALLPGAAKNEVLAGVIIHRQVISYGVAVSGRSAKISAAKKAMMKIEMMTPREFRRAYRCNCPIPEDEGDVNYETRLRVADDHTTLDVPEPGTEGTRKTAGVAAATEYGVAT